MNLVKSSSKLLLFLLILCFSVNTNAQFKDYQFKGGVQLNGLYPTGEFQDYGLKTSYIIRALVRYELSPLFDLEGGAGYGSYAGLDRGLTQPKDYWRTQIIPFDARLLVSPFDLEKINPYGYLGVGALNFKVTDKPVTPAPSETNEDGWAVFIPVGIGLEYAITDNWIADFSAGYGYVFRDDLNYHDNSSTQGNDDGWVNVGVGILYAPFTNSDEDNDGLMKNEEEDLGTDPLNPDTDGDGLKDGEEIKTFNTDPLNADSDGDGLADGAEVKEYKTNPNKADTDGDGLSDGDEVKTHYTDPLKTDSDGDSLSDGDEVNTYKTNPNKADSDSDGLDDAKEISLKTNPNNKDSDNDGLNDGEEVNKHNTNPLKADTDDGSIDDLREITRGTNPLNPEDDVIIEATEIVLEGVTFATGSAEVTPESETELLLVLNTLKAYPDMEVQIIGYTDNVGSERNNQALSERRAKSVVQWLVNKGIDSNRLVAVGKGEESPIAVNNTPEGRAKNRRIEFRRIN